MDSPKFIRLKQAINQRQQEQDPNSYVDPRAMVADKFRKEEALRRIMGEESPESVYTEGQPGLEDPLIPNPVEAIADPTLLGKTGIKVGTKGIPMLLALTRKESADVLKRSIDPKTKLLSVDSLLKNVRNGPGERVLQDLSDIHGAAALEATGKLESPKVWRDVTETVYPNVSKNLEFIERPMTRLDGQFDPNTGKVLINKNIGDLSKVSAGLHEPQHAVETIINPTKEYREYLDEKNIEELLKQNPQYLKALQNKFKNIDLNRKRKPKESLLTPEQGEFLNEIGFYNSPERFLKTHTAKHHVEYPINLEAEQAVELMNNAILGKPLVKDSALTDDMLKKWLKSLSNPRLNPKKKK